MHQVISGSKLSLFDGRFVFFTGVLGAGTLITTPVSTLFSSLLKLLEVQFLYYTLPVRSLAGSEKSSWPSLAQTHEPWADTEISLSRRTKVTVPLNLFGYRSFSIDNP